MDSGEPLHDTATVRALDRAAIEGGIPAFELMRRAAQAAFLALRRAWPDAGRVAVACGSGNNGGDGFLLACLLREAGLHVHVGAAAASATTSAEARQARAAWERHGPVLGLHQLHAHAADVAVDALLGIGLAQAPQGGMAQAIDALNACGAEVFALDVPSGLDADRGSAPGVAVRAARTLTFIADKRGLHTGQGRACSGVVEVATLDLDGALVATHAPSARLLDARNLAHWLKPRARNAHKGDHGHVLCIGGDHGMGGAVRLCAEGALRAGAGWTSVATRAGHVAALLSARPEAMTRAVESDEDLAPLLERAGVVALGPGLGQGDWGRALFADALRSGKPLVVDADGLNLLASGGHPSAATPRAVPGDRADRVLTPHPGEAARLLGCGVREIEADRFAAAARLASQYDAVVILKGAGSVVAAPGRVPCVIGAGNPGMASAGMGDVLTGVVAGLRAQGLGAFDAACAGALLHAAAGDAAARAAGERGLLASDLFAPLQRLANPAPAA
jgi:NAD(P)H-hydrate epimerase